MVQGRALPNVHKGHEYLKQKIDANVKNELKLSIRIGRITSSRPVIDMRNR